MGGIRQCCTSYWASYRTLGFSSFLVPSLSLVFVASTKLSLRDEHQPTPHCSRPNVGLYCYSPMCQGC